MQDGDQVGSDLLLPQPLPFLPSHSPIASPSKVMRQFSRTSIMISHSLHPSQTDSWESLKIVEGNLPPRKSYQGRATVNSLPFAA